MAMLAVMNFMGQGVVYRNEFKAREWAEKACDGGVQEACQMNTWLNNRTNNFNYIKPLTR